MPPTGYRRLLRWVALPVTDRRWAAPLSALALGFGLFVGVAIGPGAPGTFATGAAQIIEIPGFGGGGDAADEDVKNGGPSPATDGAGNGRGSTASAGSASPSFVPILPVEEGSASTEVPEPAPPPEKSPPPADESQPEKEDLAGTVLHVNPAAGSYTLVESGGALDVIHTAKAPQPGTKLSVAARPLANGTFAAAGEPIKSGRQTRARFSGIVTYVDPTPTAPAYTVSKRGISVLVHVHPDPAGAAPSLPALGAFADVAVDIEEPPSPPPVTSESPAPPAEPAPAPNEAVVLVPPPTVEPSQTTPTPVPPTCVPDPSVQPPAANQPSAILWQRHASADGTPLTYGDLAGIVEAVCPEAGQLLLSADDIDESGHDLAVAVPATIDASELEVGQSVVATATIGAEGALTLSGLASDERTEGADDEGLTRGDLDVAGAERRLRLRPGPVQQQGQLPGLSQQDPVGAP